VRVGRPDELKHFGKRVKRYLKQQYKQSRFALRNHEFLNIGWVLDGFSPGMALHSVSKGDMV
jgi:hypothetical protein